MGFNKLKILIRRRSCMSCNDPYGIKSFKQKEKEEKQRVEGHDLLVSQIAKELKNIGVRLERIEEKIKEKI